MSKATSISIIIVLFSAFFRVDKAIGSTLNDSIYIYANFFNHMTNEMTEGTEVEILNLEREIVNKATVGTFQGGINGRRYNFRILIPRTLKEYFIVVDVPNYMRFEKKMKSSIGKREDYIPLSSFFLEPKSGKEFKTVNLDEVTVNATKVKMVMHGDTIVYNADAFQLSNGSMLDELVRRLPGVQLNGNQITVNGRFVSSLLVNGDDFFRGDPGIALQNLPAYTVKHIKVYERQGDLDKFMGKEKLKGKEPLVMDVRLKKEYMQGLLANADMGGGTHSRWLARIFGLRYTKNSRIALFGNLNNTNDTRMPGSDGNWRSAWRASGATTLRSAGTDYNFGDNLGIVKWKGNTRYQFEKIDNDAFTATQRFLEGGDQFGRENSRSVSTTKTWRTENELRLTWPRLMMEIEPVFEYRKGDRSSSSLSAVFSQNPLESRKGASLDSIFMPAGSARLDSILVNRQWQEARRYTRSYEGALSVSGSWLLPKTSDAIQFKSSSSLSRRKENAHSLYGLRYHNGQDDDRNKYAEDRANSFSTSVSATYLPNLPTHGALIWVWPSYSYSHTYNHGDHRLYRLDRYAAYKSWEDMSLHTLPSTCDSLEQVRDWRNSYRSRLYKDNHSLSVSMYFKINKKKQIGILLEPKISYEKERVKYEKNWSYIEKDQDIIAFEPVIAYHVDGNKESDIRYSMRYSMPNLLDKIDMTDDEDPLYVWTGNPHLRNTVTHRITAYRTLTFKTSRVYGRLSGEWNVISHAVGNYVTYNQLTGVRHATPRNINGNWNAKGGLNLVVPLGRKSPWTLENNTDASYANNVDYVSVGEGPDNNPRSSVRSTNLMETLKFSYSKGGCSFGMSLSGNYLHAQSPRADFETINTADVSYGLTANVNLPWKVKLSTDLTLYSRYGYSDHAMNTNDLVWNGRVERSFGKFTFMLDGFDILHQLSNVRRVVNAQGRTETWYNTVPSYAMLHVVYRLHVKPKKAK